MSATVESARRFYLLKAQTHADRLEWGQALAFYGKQEAMSATALPLTFPLLSQLSAAHYTTVEDLTGADVAELRRRVQLKTSEAQAVLKALADL